MTITILGFFLIPLGIILIFFRPSYLLPLAIIFGGFSGSAVALIGRDLGIQPSYWFTILWLFHRIHSGRVKFGLIKRVIRHNIFLFIFTAYASFSIIIPFFLENGITIMNVDGEIAKLSFSVSCITQLLYLWFCVIFFITFSVYYYMHKQKTELFPKYYLIGATVVCLVCIYQIIAFRTGLPFDSIFRQNIHGNIQGSRIYGPCLEASVLCYYLVSALPISVRDDSSISILLTITIIGLGIYSFSSTFIVGMLLWIIMEIAFNNKMLRMKLSTNNLIVFFSSIIIVIIIGICFHSYIIFALDKLINTYKGVNLSGLRRAEAFKILINAFKQSPIFGVGFGTCRGKDLFSTWLAELGIIGMLLFLSYLIRTELNETNIGFRIAFLVTWVIMMISIPEPYNLFIWMLASFATMKKNDISIKEDITLDNGNVIFS